MKEGKFNKKFKWLHIFDEPSTLDDSKYHYFSHPVPGYQKVSLIRSSKRPLTMYYELNCLEQNQQVGENSQTFTRKDESTIRDFEHMDWGSKKAAEDIVVDRSSIVSDSQWVKKYEPNKFIELLTDEKVNRDILTWLKAWDPIVFQKDHHHKIENRNNQYSVVFHHSSKDKNYSTGQGQNVFANHRRMILLAGPPGCGKTTLIRVLANHCKYQVEEINASEDRSANNLIKKLEDIAGNETIRQNQKPTLICLDQVDGAAENEASGFSKVLQFIETGNKDGKGRNKKNLNEDKAKKQGKYQNRSNYPSKFGNSGNTTGTFPNRYQHLSTASLNRPVIFICNDPYAKSLKELRSKAHVVYFSALNSQKVIKRMKDIIEKEKVYIELAVLQKICEICKNDVRSCIGILQLIAKQKKISGRSPKDIINRMKLSFAKDNESTMNEFMYKIFHSTHLKNQNSLVLNSVPILKQIQREVIEIGNSSMLMESFLQNLIHVKGITRKGSVFLNLYCDMVKADVLLRNGYKYNHELENYQMIPYANFALHFHVDEVRKIEFPRSFFERLKKNKSHQETLNNIYDNLPLLIRIFIHKKGLMSSYLLLLYLSMQCSSTREDELNKCVCRMITYNFCLKKDFKDSKNSIFQPEIDSVLTFGSRKPEQLISNMTKALMEENYQFFKERKQLFSGTELKDSTEALLNQMQIQSRKKRKQEDGFKFKYLQGTGTKTSYVLSMDYFFK